MLNAGRAYYRLSADLIDSFITGLFSSACVYCNLIELNRPTDIQSVYSLGNRNKRMIKKMRA